MRLAQFGEERVERLNAVSTAEARLEHRGPEVGVEVDLARGERAVEVESEQGCHLTTECLQSARSSALPRFGEQQLLHGPGRGP